MVNIVGKIDGINLYSDEYQALNKIIKGRKQGESGYKFMVAHPTTAYNMIMESRRNKILKIKKKYVR